MDCGEWKAVPGIEASKLLVSSEGWIRTRRKSKGGVQALGPPQKGSLGNTVTFRTAVDGKMYLVHRLVALAFLGPPPTSSHSVDHCNQNSTDNRVSNLRWATKSEQTLNQGKRKVQRSANPVILVSPEGTIQEYDSVYAAAIAIGAKPGNVTNSINYGWRVNGYNAEYQPGEDQGDIVVDGEVERWKVAEGNHNLFVSTMGRIQFRHHAGRMGFRKTPVPNKRLGGYCFVHVGQSDVLVHRLVMQTFVGPPQDNTNTTVDHINHIRRDNRLSNLRYASVAQQRLNQARNVINEDDLYVAPSNISFAERKRHYKRPGMDGIWMVRSAGKRVRWCRSTCVLEKSNEVGGSGAQ
tara:strand:+ start:703 stop:1755 length:1053 start_codon:yes stop_codon:yes gene_type:complete